MRAEQRLARYVEQVAQGIHRARQKSLLCAVEGLVRARRVGICAIGRAVLSEAFAKHRIERIDRLVGSKRFHQDVRLLASRHTRRVIASLKRPHILVDWTQINQTHWALSASLVWQGRALPLLQRVWRQRVVGRASVHKPFIAQLACSLSEQCKPIVITDAGFKVPWFRAVQAQGWDVVARLSMNMMVQKVDESRWRKLHALAQGAGATPRSHGQVILTRSNPYRVRLVIQSAIPKGRRGRGAKGRRATFCHPKSHLYKHYQKRAKTPWLIATTLPRVSASQVVRLYAQRMQCEQTFRDLKNPRFGLGAEMLASRTAKRLEVLLFIATLAFSIAMAMGRHAELQGQHRRFQANTVKRRVLSHCYLGLILWAQQLLANPPVYYTYRSPTPQ